MTNEQIIKDIKSRLTKDKDTDVAYLQTEMGIYKQLQNEEVIYAIASMLFEYLDPSVKEKLDLKTHAILDERRAEYEKVVGLLNEEKYEEAKQILLNLIDVFEKATYTGDMHYYDFDQMIEYFIFCENVANGRRLKIKRYPEPLTYYMYQLASIYLQENDIKNAINALNKGLKYNPRCMYIMQQLSVLYKEIGDTDKQYEVLIDILKYAYAKDQLAFAYENLGEYFKNKEAMDISCECYSLSEEILKNNIIPNKKDSILCFIKYKVPYGISEIVINAINDFLEYTKKINDVETAMYIAFTAYELTDDNKYLSELETLKEATDNE